MLMGISFSKNNPQCHPLLERKPLNASYGSQYAAINRHEDWNDCDSYAGVSDLSG